MPSSTKSAVEKVQLFLESGVGNSLKSCQCCQRVIELYNMRHQALTFKTEQTLEELKRLKLKLITHWSEDNVKYLVQLYLASQKNTSRQLASQAHRDVERLAKRQQVLELRERSMTAASVAEKSAGNNKAYSFFKDLMEFSQTGIQEKTITEEQPSVVKKPVMMSKRYRSLKVLSTS